MKAKTAVEAAEVLAKFRDVFDPVSKRRDWYNSRLVLLDDGTTRPVLHVLAEERFGPLGSRWKPYWVDKDWTNETMDNVAVSDMQVEETKRVTKYGVPAGTPEYYRKYRAENGEERRRYYRERYKKRAALLKDLQERLRREAAMEPPQALKDLLANLDK